jgi:hypothetical protein
MARRHARRVIAVALAVAVAGFLWFRPDKLFVDEVVDEDIPAAAGTPPARDAEHGDGGEPPPPDPDVLAEGGFVSHGRYTTTGDALVLDTGDGRRVLRLRDFSTSNGPDLRVYLSAAPPGEQGRALADDFVDLGPLKGNVGNQNYPLPADVDMDTHSTVVIWCVRFTVSFGAAELTTSDD